MTRKEAILKIGELVVYARTQGWDDVYTGAFKTLDQESEWIPVSERLPKNDEDVLVCSSQGAMEVCYYHIDGTFYPTEYEDLNETGWYNEDDDLLGFEPIAWMPLPEPYMEGVDG